MDILPWNEADENAALKYLKDRYETSMFLLGNFETQGPVAGTHPNSGDFKVITNGQEITGAFCVTRRGNVLVQANDHSRETVAAIRQTCADSAIPLKGVAGPWDLCSALWEDLTREALVGAASYHEREPLYRLEDLTQFASYKDPAIRNLETRDFDQWLPLRQDYLVGEGLSNDMSPEQMKVSFDSLVERKMIWGVFADERLAAMTGLNAKAFDVGQVGGVFTPIASRKRGLAKRAMKAMIRDCLQNQGVNKMILFTGEKNKAAQALYESLSFERIGAFGLIFS